MSAKAKEAFPILKRKKHVFKIGTLYVVDKFNFDHLKQLKEREKYKEQLNEGQNEEQKMPNYSPTPETSGGKMRKDTNIEKIMEGQKFVTETRKNKLHYQRHKRRARTPINKQNPSHFSHGERNVKNCLVCECKQKQTALKQESMPVNHNQSEKKEETKTSQKPKPEKVHYHKPPDTIPENPSLNEKQAPSVDGFDLNNLQVPQPTIPLQKNLSTKKQHPTQHGSPNKRDQDIEEFWKRRITLDDFIQGTPTISLTFSKHVKKFNRELLKACCQVIGCKPLNANQIAEGVFDEFNQILNNLSENVDFEDHFDLKLADEQGILFNIPQDYQNRTHYPQIQTVTTSGPLFKYILQKHLEKYKYYKPEYQKDFYIASDLVQQKKNIIILLSGTSGTGKSTLASLLGSRLGISTVLSTDTIRHIQRNFVSKEECPILFASTYETAAYVSEDITSEKKRTLLGYKDQCNRVLTELEKVIDEYQAKNQSLVVEGVHLTVRFMVNMMKKYPSCIPFVVCIQNEEKHKERFAVRTKHMTIDPRYNKYIKHVKNIRIIQKHLIKKAEAALIPRIDNSNVDKSIGLIHVTIVRCLRQITEGGSIFDAQRKQATGMHQEFNVISKNQLSSKDAQQLIHSKVNKNEILELYMQKANPQIVDRLKNYKRASSMIDMKTRNKKKKKQDEKEETQAVNEAEEEEAEASPRAKSIHIMLRIEDDEENKVSEMEKKSIKRRFISEFQQFPVDEEGFEEDSKAAKLAASQMPQQKPKKQDKKEKVLDQEVIRQKEEKKRQSDQQKKIEEEKLQAAVLEAQKKMKEEQEAEAKAEAEKIEKEKQEKISQQQQQDLQDQKSKIEQLMQKLENQPKSQSLNMDTKLMLSRIESTESSGKKGKGTNKSFEVDFLDEEEQVTEKPKKATPSKFKPDENEDSSNIEIKRFDSLKQIDKKGADSMLEMDNDTIKLQKTKTTKNIEPETTKSLSIMIRQEENKSERSSDGGSSGQQEQYRSAGRVPLKESSFKPEGVPTAGQKRDKSFHETSLQESDQTISLKNQNVKVKTETPDKLKLRSEYQFSTKIPHLKDKRRNRLFGNLISGMKRKKAGLQHQHSSQGLMSATPMNKSTTNLTTLKSDSPQNFNAEAAKQKNLAQQQQTDETTEALNLTKERSLQNRHDIATMEDTQSIYSGNSGLASLVSQSIDYFQVVENYEDNHSAKLQEESGESGDSDDTDSMRPDPSDHDTIDEVDYSHSTISDHEDEQEDVIAAKEQSFNNKQVKQSQNLLSYVQQEGSPLEQQQQQELHQPAKTEEVIGNSQLKQLLSPEDETQSCTSIVDPSRLQQPALNSKEKQSA